ncbi:MAG: 50S ribosomal protein L30 [Schleiferiaceae bacterium]
MSKVRIKQVRSVINRTSRQKKTMQALGLSKINAVVEKEVTPQITGMINAVSHLIEVEEVK